MKQIPALQSCIENWPHFYIVVEKLFMGFFWLWDDHIISWSRIPSWWTPYGFFIGTARCTTMNLLQITPTFLFLKPVMWILVRISNDCGADWITSSVLVIYKRTHFSNRPLTPLDLDCFWWLLTILFRFWNFWSYLIAFDPFDHFFLPLFAFDYYGIITSFNKLHHFFYL